MPNPLAAAQLKKTQAQADRELFMNSVLAASYFKADDVRAVVSDMNYVIKAAFTEFHLEVGPLLADKPKEVIMQILKKEILDRLYKLQDVDPYKIEVRNRKMTKYKQKIDENAKTRVGEKGHERIKV